MLLNSTGSSAGAQLRGGRRACLAPGPVGAPGRAVPVGASPANASLPILLPPAAAAAPQARHRGALARVYAAAVAAEASNDAISNGAGNDFTVVIAGAGISGLTLALGLLKKGVKVQVLERDVTAIRGEGKIRGPIQVQSNALAALEAIDVDVAAEVMRHGCITGDRINGLCDGVSGDWYVKFDTYHPAVDRGLPVTRVISRLTLQEVLADAVVRYGGEDTIQNGCHVVSYEECCDPATGKPRVVALLEDGRRFEGSVLVGTDGIWSKVRKQMLGESPAHYSEYTCYTGISDYVPADIDLVGYRVFLGNGQYFVSSDVGGGKMQWYAFHKEPAGGQDEPGQRKARLLRLFGHWNYNVVDLIKATPEEDVLRRDIYDRAPMFRWSLGRVALMGDSAHAMQPNLGQGGCMAIEDAFELVNDLNNAVEQGRAAGQEPDVERCLKQYQAARVIRVSAIHGMAGMAAFMASTYKAYLGEGLGPLSFFTEFQVHHPGRVAGQAILKLTMPAVLGWVLGGNTAAIESSRAPRCLLIDKPRHFDESEFEIFMRDDEVLAARANADWLLVAERTAPSTTAVAPPPPHERERVLVAAGATAAAAGRPAPPAVAAPYFPSLSSSSSDMGDTAGVAAALAAAQTYGLPPFQYKAAFLNLAAVSAATGRRTLSVGASVGNDLVVEGAGVAPLLHATVEQHAPGRFMLRDAGAGAGTWVNGQRLERCGARTLHPGDRVEFGAHPAQELYQVKLQHASYRTEVRGDVFVRVNSGAMSNVV